MRGHRLANECEAGDPTISGQDKPWERWYYKPCLRITCPTCEPILCGGTLETPSGEGLRPHRVFLGSRRMPYEQWVKTATMYTWPLWRNWTGPKVVKVETGAEVRARHLRDKPAGYSWKLEKLTPAQRVALGCVAAKPKAPAVWKLRNRTVDENGHVRWERSVA